MNCSNYSIEGIVHILCQQVFGHFYPPPPATVSIKQPPPPITSAFARPPLGPSFKITFQVFLFTRCTENTKCLPC